MRQGSKHRRRGLWADRTGAIAPTVALSLVGLLAAGGLAFDYARMAAMDTELQSAADQAALAAASQLDGKAGACSRAANAAVGMVANQSRLANDGGGLAVTVPLEAACDAAGNVRFYQDILKATPATSDANAKFVEVSVVSRTAEYALTPIVALVDSGAMDGTAFAGMKSVICRVPPVMLCNPAEVSDPDFDVDLYRGVGIRLVAQGGGGAYAPGNFGFLDTGLDAAGGGASLLRKMLGQTTPLGDCIEADGVTTEPGAMVSVLDAINTRFDIYSANVSQNQVCGSGQCPPSINTRKDLVRQAPGGGGGNSCRLASENGGGNGWKLPNAGQYLPANPTVPLAAGVPLAPMGHPRDMCHAVSEDGVCAGGRIGNGTWDRAAYFRSNYGSAYDWQAAMLAAYGTSSVSRYQVYRWEMINATINPGGINLPVAVAPGTSHGAPICQTPGVTPTATDLDRRKLTAAVINCTAEGVAGKTPDVSVAKWIDIFLVEPSAARPRTNAGDLYVEVVGEATIAGVDGQTQQIAKSTPYLIE